MKATFKLIGGLVLAGLLHWTGILHAQNSEKFSDKNQPDSIVRLTAEARGLRPVPAKELPHGGTFWVVTSNGVSAPYPFMPADEALPAYVITDGIFLVDETHGLVSLQPNRFRPKPTADDVAAALEALASSVVDLIGEIQDAPLLKQMSQALGLEKMRADGGGMGSPFGMVDTNALWLDITNYGNGLAYVNLNNATNLVYEILTKTNLLQPAWQFELALWPTNPVVMPFTVPVGNRQDALFIWARDWTGVDDNANGLPDWWEWKYFGYFGVDPNGDPDGDGMSNLQEYLTGNNPLQTRTMVVAWGNNANGQCNVPSDLTNAVAVGGGGDATHGYCVALKADGTLVAWGDNTFGQTNIPSGLTNVTQIATGPDHGLALRNNGTVAAWGSWFASGFPAIAIPTNLSNIMGLAAGSQHDLAVTSNGQVIAWGYDTNASYVQVPTNLPPAKAVSAGWAHSVALLTNGTITMWGSGALPVPGNLSNVVAIAAGAFHTLALKADGTVVAMGDTNSSLFFTYQGESTVPAGLSNVVAVAASLYFSMALKSDGTVVMWGNALGLPSYPLNQIRAVGRGLNHAVAIRGGLLTPIIAAQPVSQVVPLGTNVTFSIQALGLAGTAYQWQFNNVNLAGKTNAAIPLNNVQGSDSGNYRCLVSNSDGSIFSSNALLTVVLPPVIQSRSLPAITNALFQSNLTLSVVSTGIGYTNNFQWKFNGGNIANATGNFYTISNALTATAGTYAVVIANIAGSTNVSWTVGVVNPAGILIYQQPTNRYQLAGGSVAFAVGAVSSNAVTYQWQFNGTNLLNATNATLAVNNVQSANEGLYVAAVSDGVNNLASSNASFALVTLPVITSQSPATNLLASYQRNVVLGMAVTAPGMTNGFPLSYRWLFNGTNSVGGNTAAYTFVADSNKLGNYFVIVSNAVGSATSLVWQVSMTYVGSYIAPDTLAYHLSTNAVGHTNGISSTYAGTIALANWNYTSYYGTNLAFLTNSVWSTNFWLNGVQGLSATCIGYSNGLGAQGLVTMVSPRHYLMASHVGGGQLMAFLDTNNAIYWRTTMQRVDIPASFTYGIMNDISVGILNADLPSSVGYLPVLPTNFTNYFPTNNSSIVQGVGMNQDMRIFSQPMTFGGNIFINWSSANACPFGLNTDWNVTIRGGDSSNPERVLIGNNLVLVSHNFHVSDGPNYAYQINAINQQMHYLSTNNAVGTDYQLTTFSLTNWPVINP